MFKKMLILVLMGCGFVVNAFSNEPMLKPTPFSKIENKIGKEPMMLEFGATSCIACRAMGKTLYKIKQKYPKSSIYFIDIYNDLKSAKRFKIRLIPTQIYLDKSGKVIDTHIGIINQKELEQKLREYRVLK